MPAGSSLANTWTDTMYAMMDADYFVSCLYFIVGLVIINYWFVHLHFSPLLAMKLTRSRNVQAHQSVHGRHHLNFCRHPR